MSRDAHDSDIGTTLAPSFTTLDFCLGRPCLGIGRRASAEGQCPSVCKHAVSSLNPIS